MILVVNFIFAAIGMIMFRANDPQHFGNMLPAFITVWQIETLDAWEVGGGEGRAGTRAGL